MNLSNLMRLGSSRTKQETCKTCLNPGQTVVAVSLVLYHYKKTLADGTENLGISQLKTALPLYSGRQLVELVCLVAIWELFFFFFWIYLVHLSTHSLFPTQSLRLTSSAWRI